jgi:hypothetical protein
VATTLKNFPKEQGVVIGIVKSFFGLAGSVYAQVFLGTPLPFFSLLPHATPLPFFALLPHATLLFDQQNHKQNSIF